MRARSRARISARHEKRQLSATELWSVGWRRPLFGRNPPDTVVARFSRERPRAELPTSLVTQASYKGRFPRRHIISEIGVIVPA
jgi:hypothetical protein